MSDMNSLSISDSVLQGHIVAIPSRDLKKYRLTAEDLKCTYTHPNQIKEIHKEKKLIKIGDFDERESRTWRSYEESRKP